MSQRQPRSLVRSVTGDVRRGVLAAVRCLFWSFKGKRITPDSRVLQEALMETGMMIGDRSRLGGNGGIGATVYGYLVRLERAHIRRLRAVVPLTSTGLSKRPVDDPLTQPAGYDAPDSDAQLLRLGIGVGVRIGPDVVVRYGVKTGHWSVRGARAS